MGPSHSNTVDPASPNPFYMGDYEAIIRHYLAPRIIPIWRRLKISSTTWVRSKSILSLAAMIAMIFFAQYRNSIYTDSLGLSIKVSHKKKKNLCSISNTKDHFTDIFYRMK